MEHTQTHKSKSDHWPNWLAATMNGIPGLFYITDSFFCVAINYTTIDFSPKQFLTLYLLLTVIIIVFPTTTVKDDSLSPVVKIWRDLVIVDTWVYVKPHYCQMRSHKTLYLLSSYHIYCSTYDSSSGFSQNQCYRLKLKSRIKGTSTSYGLFSSLAWRHMIDAVIVEQINIMN